jgi:hypothetical protein
MFETGSGTGGGSQTFSNNSMTITGAVYGNVTMFKRAGRGIARPRAITERLGPDFGKLIDSAQSSVEDFSSAFGVIAQAADTSGVSGRV